MLGERLGVRRRADELLGAMDRKIAQARAGAARPRVRTLIYEPNGYATAGGVTDEVMGLAGLTNAAPGFTPTRQGTIPIEAVIAAAPELLILNGVPGEHSARADLILRHPALAALEGRTLVAWVPLTALLCPGPWSLDTAATFGALAAKARALAQLRPRN
jgi:iron complex transport system substrate-binding protein